MGTEYSVRASGAIPLKKGITHWHLNKVSGSDRLYLQIVDDNFVVYEYTDEGKSLSRVEAAERFLKFVERNYARDAWVEDYQQESDHGCFDSNSIRGPRKAVIRLRLDQIEKELAALAKEQQELLAKLAT